MITTSGYLFGNWGIFHQLQLMSVHYQEHPGSGLVREDTRLLLIDTIIDHGIYDRLRGNLSLLTTQQATDIYRQHHVGTHAHYYDHEQTQLRLTSLEWNPHLQILYQYCYCKGAPTNHPNRYKDLPHSNLHDSSQTSLEHSSENRLTCPQYHPSHLGPLDDTFNKRKPPPRIAGSDLYHPIPWQKFSSVLQQRWLPQQAVRLSPLEGIISLVQ